MAKGSLCAFVYNIECWAMIDDWETYDEVLIQVTHTFL